MANCEHDENGKFKKRTVLTPLQLQVIAELITGDNKTDVCKKLDVPRATLYKWLNTDLFMDEYRKQCEAMYKKYLGDAIKGIADVAKHGSGRDKVKACETILKLNDYLDTKVDVKGNTTVEFVVSLESEE